MNNLSVRTKLFVAFGFLMLLAVIQGLCGWWMMGNVNAAAREIGEHWLVSVRSISAMKTGVAEARIAEYAEVIAPSVEKMKAAEKAVDTAMGEYKEAAEAYEKLPRSTEQEEKYQQYLSKLKTYLEMHANIVALSRADKDAEAKELLDGESFKTYNDATDALDELVKLNGEGADQSVSDAQTTGRTAGRIIFSLVGLTVLISLGAGLVMTRLIARPVNAMTGVMGELAGNNLSVEVPFAERGDEIGSMAKAVSHFKNQLVRVKQLEASQEEQKRRAEADRLAAMRKMADTFEASVGKVIETVTSAATELQAASGQMAGTATETSVQATTVASSAQQASANVQTVASASEELTSSIREIAHQMERSQTVARRASEEVGTTTSQVRTLSDSVAKIGEIVKLINDIASQTNLLALNATIEAARAGDAGKGFAVVAGEVKNLANQTARATSEIAGQIQAVQDGTDLAVRAIDSVSQVIGEMAEIGSAVAAAVEQQTAATGEIARNVEQAAEGTSEVSSNIVSVELAARETGAAAEQIKSSAMDLSKQAEFLRHEVGQFLSQVRADKNDMALMTWSEDLAMGIPSIDRHHQEIFNRVNEFYRQMMGGDGGGAAIAMLSEIDRGFRNHFDEEEALMTRHRYGGIDGHRRNHKAFLEGIVDLRAGIETNRADAGAKLFDYVATWFGEHIRNDDKQLAYFLSEKKMAA